MPTAKERAQAWWETFITGAEEGEGLPEEFAFAALERAFQITEDVALEKAAEAVGELFGGRPYFVRSVQEAVVLTGMVRDAQRRIRGLKSKPQTPTALRGC